MYKVYKIRVKGTNEYYYTAVPTYYDQRTHVRHFELRTTYFDKAKIYDNLKSAKRVARSLIKGNAACMDSMGNILFDKPIIEIVEFSTTESGVITTCEK